MKKIALFAAAAAMVSASPALAAGGYVGVEYASSDITLLSELESETTRAEFAVGFNGANWGAQLEGSLGTIEVSADTDVNTVAGHLWYAGDKWRLGGVFARASADDFDWTEWSYGVEGTFDVTPNAVLLASVTTGEAEGNDTDLVNYDLGFNYYVTPNLRLGAQYGFARLDSGGGADDAENYGFNGEYQPFSAPISLTLGWMHYEIADGPIGSETVMAGVRWNFGGATLRDRDNITPFNATTGLNARLLGVY